MGIKLTFSLKVLSLLMFCLLFVNMVSAELLTIDNWKNYDSVTREVVVKDLTGEIGKARLNTPLSVKVATGYQKVAEFDLWAYEDYNDIIRSIDFYDKNQKDWEKHKLTMEFDIKYKSYEDVEVDDFDLVCGVDPKSLNKTEVCSYEKVGSHIEKQEVWQKVTPAVLKKNEVVTVGIFTNVEYGDHVEWIPSIYGVKVEEWAEWTSDLNVGLISYYKLDLTTGSIKDELNLNNGTNNGATRGTIGILENAINLSGTANTEVQLPITNLLPWGTNAFSVSVWERFISVPTSNQALFSATNYAGANGILIAYDTGGGTMNFYKIGVTTLSYSWTPDTSWHHWVFVGNSSGMFIYLDGNLVKNSTNSANIANPSTRGAIGSYPQGASTSIWNFNGTLDEVGIWSKGLVGAEVTSLFGGGNPPSFNSSGDQAPTITLNSPTVDANYSTPQTITFNFTASDDINLSDVKLFVNTVLNQTNATGLNNTDYLFDLNLGDGTYQVYGTATDNNSAQTSTGTVNITIDSISPFIAQSGLENLTTFSLPINSTWYLNASDTHLDKCYYNTTDHATSIVTCNSSIGTAWATEGAKTITYCANDTFGNENCSSENIYIFSLSEDQGDNPDPAVEGFDVTFNLTVNLTNIPTTTAYLVLNDTIYNPTTTQAGTNGYFFEVAFEVPDTWGNSSGIVYDWFWNYTIAGVVTNESTNTTNITVYEIAVDDCSTYGDVILDMNLFDEETATAVNESAGANVEIDLTITSKENSSVALTYNNTWTNENNPQVCIPANVLNNTEWWIDFTVGFSSTDHVWEFYYLDDGTLNSTKVFDVQTSTPLYLMDLKTDDSTSFLFNYFDQDGLPVEDAIVHVYRKYIGEGTFREVERARADLNGDTIVHLVEEDVIYYFVISQYGEILFTTSTYTALCQATPCTIQIEAGGSTATFPTDWDLVDGGAYSISSSANTREVNLTFTTDDTSTFNLTVYKYESDGSYTAINTSSATGTSGTVVMTVPQSAGNVSFFASVVKDDVFVNSEWVDFESNPQDRFGVTLALFIGALIILSLGLMAVTEGVGTLVFVILGVALSGFLGLVTTELSTGVNVVVYLVIAGGILLWKLTGGRR